MFDEDCALVASCARINEIPQPPCLWKMQREITEKETPHSSGGYSWAPTISAEVKLGWDDSQEGKCERQQ